MTSTGAPETVATVAGLRVDFPRRGGVVHALRGIELQIGRGEIVGLVGESGSGKTILGLALLGLLPGTAQVSGSVVVTGVDMVGPDAEATRAARREHLGAVFQDPMTSLNPTMRVGRQLLEVSGSTAETLRLLEAVGIRDAQRRLKAFPHELSGGQRQRVMLAMALAGRPRLVIADEPTTALDVTVQARVLELFRAVRDEFGCAILLVTHDLGVASSIADRIAVAYAGRLVETGSARDMLGRPAHPYTAALLASRITLRADRARQLPVIAGEPPDPRLPDAGCAFAPRCPSATDRCVEDRPLLLAASLHPGLVACHYEAGSEWSSRGETAAWSMASTARGGARVTGVSVIFAAKRGLRRTEAHTALDEVNLDIDAGEAVALVGESGSGKTTLLRVLAGLQQPTSGTVELASNARPQMVFQDAGASLTPWLHVRELMDDRLRDRPRGERRERVDATLTHLGLPPEAADSRPFELSGGQRQRVALARAVVVVPDLLLCDEPISALDASLAATVLNLLGRLRRELGFAMVFVTHDLAAARLIADRVVVMTEGRIVESGSTDKLVGAPEHAYTEALLAAVPEVPTWS